MKNRQLIKKLFNNNLEEPFIVAEISGNHKQSKSIAKKLIKEIQKSGAQAVKLQTYTPDTMTFDLKDDEFLIKNKKSLWCGEYLYDLYKKAHTPWSWQKELFNYAESMGLICFSSVFDDTSINFLNKINNPIYKISSFENTDLELIKNASLKKKPIILSTGLASLPDLKEAVKTIKKYGSGKFALLKCTSSYPAKSIDNNLLTIKDISKKFDCVVGLSDHTEGIEIPIAAVAMGAKIIEKHVKLEDDNVSVDSKFAISTNELKKMVSSCKNVFNARGKIFYGATKTEIPSLKSIRTLYYNKNLEKDHKLEKRDLKRSRPGNGLKIKYLDKIIGKKIKKNVKIGMPVTLKDF
jgi:pseudaminic acid synthase